MYIALATYVATRVLLPSRFTRQRWVCLSYQQTMLERHGASSTADFLLLRAGVPALIGA